MPHLASPSDLDLIAEFCAQADVTDATRIKYRFHMTEFARWLAHPKSRSSAGSGLEHATKADVVRHLAYLLTGDRFASLSTTGPALSASSRKSVIGSLQAFYRYAVDVAICQFDPVRGVVRPKTAARRGHCLTAAQARQLLSAPGEPRDRIQTYLLTYTGARAGEIRDLRWQDVNFPERTMLLRGKAARPRVIDIHPRLMSELRRWFLYVDHRAEHNPAIAESLRHPERDFVLLTRTGRQIPQTAIWKQLKDRAVRAGLGEKDPTTGHVRSKVTPHALRRTFATILLNDGHHLDAVADVLGHQSVDTTRRHYAFSSNARRRATIEAFNV